MDEIKAERVERIEEELEKMRSRQHISNKNEIKKALQILGKSEFTVFVSFIFKKEKTKKKWKDISDEKVKQVMGLDDEQIKQAKEERIVEQER